MFKRSSGVLIHITSLPGEYGIGDFGRKTYEFIDFLDNAGQKLWQILPMGQTGHGDSPYQSFSAFAGNPYFIDLEELIDDGLLEVEDLDKLKELNNKEVVDYGLLYNQKIPLLKKAYEKFIEKDLMKETLEFQKDNRYWLEDYGLFMALKAKFDNKYWGSWPKEYKFRNKKTINNIKKELKKEIDYFIFIQYYFEKQWLKVRKYANEKGIKVIGDIPIFVSGDSVEAWANERLFDFNKYKKPRKIAVCPPDMFSKDGQLWGNPLYNWNYMKKTGYDWWVKRIESCFKMHDIVRIDHFRGFESYWAIQSGAKTAKKGYWKKGPGMDLFRAIENRLGKLPIIAEDLGFLTPKVKKLLADSGYPGMKILQFAFDQDEKNDYLPHKYIQNSVAYTGTHDNETITGWDENLKVDNKVYFENYMNSEEFLNVIKGVEAKEMNWRFIETVWSSKSIIAIAQMQDFLGLGNKSRMNTPSTIDTNWKWRLKDEDITIDLAERMRKVTEKTSR